MSEHSSPPPVRSLPRAVHRLGFALWPWGALGGFVALALAVQLGLTAGWDAALLLALRGPAAPELQRGPRWLADFMRDMTALGGAPVVGLLTAVAAIGLLACRRADLAWLLLLSLVGGQMLSLLLKWGFNRPRPLLVPHGAVAYFTSFPSGHAMSAAAFYGTLALLWARQGVARQGGARRWAWVGGGLAVVVSGLVGVSRVYLGVHWPSDVLAGWLLGGLWAWAVVDAAYPRMRLRPLRPHNTRPHNTRPHNTQEDT
jgi:undecaprenyl-diphosphatase